jgi:hypothetical protein
VWRRRRCAARLGPGELPRAPVQPSRPFQGARGGTEFLFTGGGGRGGGKRVSLSAAKLVSPRPRAERQAGRARLEEGVGDSIPAPGEGLDLSPALASEGELLQPEILSRKKKKTHEPPGQR